MKFIEIPELTTNDKVYFHNSFRDNVIHDLRRMQDIFKNCDDYCYFTDIEIIKMEKNGNVLLFTYRKDKKNVVFIYGNSAYNSVSICNKEIFMYIKKQILSNNKNEELIIPNLNNITLKAMDKDFFDLYKTSFVYKYCYARF